MDPYHPHSDHSKMQKKTSFFIKNHDFCLHQKYWFFGCEKAIKKAYGRDLSIYSKFSRKNIHHYHNVLLCEVWTYKKSEPYFSFITRETRDNSYHVGIAMSYPFLFLVLSNDGSNMFQSQIERKLWESYIDFAQFPFKSLLFRFI